MFSAACSYSGRRGRLFCRGCSLLGRETSQINHEQENRVLENDHLKVFLRFGALPPGNDREPWVEEVEKRTGPPIHPSRKPGRHPDGIGSSRCTYCIVQLGNLTFLCRSHPTPGPGADIETDSRPLFLALTAMENDGTSSHLHNQATSRVSWRACMTPYGD